MMDFFFTGDRDYWRDPVDHRDRRTRARSKLDEQPSAARSTSPRSIASTSMAYILPSAGAADRVGPHQGRPDQGQPVEPAGNASWRLGLEIRREGEPAMLYSTDRILTTHAGSLPRPSDLRAMVVAKSAGEPYDAAALDRRLTRRWRRPCGARSNAASMSSTTANCRNTISPTMSAAAHRRATRRGPIRGGGGSA